MTVLEKYDFFTIDSIPQKDNRHSDLMARVTSLISHHDPSKDFTFFIYTIVKPLFEHKTDELLAITIKHSSKWYAMIFDYLKTSTYPKSTTRNTR